MQLADSGMLLVPLVPPDTDTLHLHPKLPPHPQQRWADTKPVHRYETPEKQKQLPLSALAALCCLSPEGTPALLSQTGLGGMSGKDSSLHLRASSTKAKKIFRKSQQCLPLSWTSRLDWVSVQPAAILILKNVLELQQLGAWSCSKAW